MSAPYTHLRRNGQAAEGRTIPASSTRYPNLTVPQYASIRKNRTRTPVALFNNSPKRLASHLKARYVDGGAEGVVYVVDLDFGGSRAFFFRMRTSLDMTVDSGLALPRYVILKTAEINDPALVDRHLRQMATHQFLSTVPPCVLVPNMTKPLCPALPRFYFGGVLHHERKDYGITVMDYVPGKPLMAYTTGQHPFTAKVYVAVERAAAALWVNGIIHGDLHRKNILYDALGSKARIIDFSFAVVLPEDYRNEIRESLGRAVSAGVRSLGEIFVASESRYGVPGLQKYINRIQAGRQLTWFNADYVSLKYLFNKLSLEERRLVPETRKAAWGAATPTPAPSTRKRTRSPRTRSPQRSPKRRSRNARA